MDLNTIFSVIGFIFSIFSLPSAIYFIVKKVIDRKHISWKKVEKGTRYLAEEVETINPDIIVTFSGRGGIAANLVLSRIKNKYPLYTCLLKDSMHSESFLFPEEWIQFTTPKWICFVPNEILKYRDKQILIIDDITRSGKTIEQLTKALIHNGIPAQNIHSMAFVADFQIMKDMQIPQVSWKQVNTDEYSLPWNKAHNPKK